MVSNKKYKYEIFLLKVDNEKEISAKATSQWPMRRFDEKIAIKSELGTSLLLISAFLQVDAKPCPSISN